MEVKKQVRQRRHERLKQLLEHTVTEESAPQIQAFPQGATSERFHAPISTSMRDEVLLQDPEYVWNLKQQAMKSDLPSQLQHEHTDQPSSHVMNTRWVWIKILICCVLFAGIGGVFQLKQPWALSTQAWVRNTLNQDLDFQALTSKYTALFNGAPSFIPTFRLGNKNQGKTEAKIVFSEMAKGFIPPVSGRIHTKFSTDIPGMRIQTIQAHAPIVALDEGRVIYVGNQAETGFTIMVQHPNYVKSIYGNVEKSMVNENDWVQAGQQIAQASLLYFSIQMKDDYINPADVISFD